MNLFNKNKKVYSDNLENISTVVGGKPIRKRMLSDEIRLEVYAHDAKEEGVTLYGVVRIKANDRFYRTLFDWSWVRDIDKWKLSDTVDAFIDDCSERASRINLKLWKRLAHLKTQKQPPFISKILSIFK